MQSIARPDFTPGHICWGYGDGLQSIRGARDTRVTNAYSSPSFSRIYFTTFSLPWTPGTFCFLLSRHSCGRLPAACQKFLSKTIQFKIQKTLRPRYPRFHAAPRLSEQYVPSPGA